MKPEAQEGKQPVGEAALRKVMMSRGWSNETLKLTFTEELCSIPTELQRKIPLIFGWKFSPCDHKSMAHGDVAHDAPALDSWISQEKDERNLQPFFRLFDLLKGLLCFLQDWKLYFFFFASGNVFPFASWPQPFCILLVPLCTPEFLMRSCMQVLK